MPRKYSLKFGGVGPGVVTQGSSNGLMIGFAIFLICLLVGVSGLIGYYGFIRETCKDKDSDGNLKYEDLCPAGKELKDAVCDSECNVSTCCKEYNCNPPDSLPRGYRLKSGTSLNTTTFKSVSDFVGGSKNITNKVECDEPNYSGIPTAISCAGNNNKKWSISGCDIATTGGLPSCSTGANPSATASPGSTPRLVGNCSDVDISISNSDNVNMRKCDSIYQSGGGGRFCYYDTNPTPDVCVVYSQDAGKCTLPVG
jgi:hypothetical protein